MHVPTKWLSNALLIQLPTQLLLTFLSYLCYSLVLAEYFFFFLNNCWVGYLLTKNLDHMSSISISIFLIVGQVIKNIWIIIVDLCIRVGYQIIG